MKHFLFTLCASAIGCALVLQFPATAIAQSKERVIVSFNGTDGSDPQAGLIDVTGTLYGTTVGGGTGGDGTVFALDQKTGVETVLYSFCSEKKCADGAGPGPLISANGMLYGATSIGGTYGNGTVFTLDLNTGSETVLYSFCSKPKCKDGGDPAAGLIKANGLLYGTTLQGGTFGGGTAFSINLGTGAETVLHSFGSGSDGQYPTASLIDVNGTLYGTTGYGGASNAGTVFALDPNTGRENVEYSFCGKRNCADGAYPVASLIDVSGTLYGATQQGGIYNAGTVFGLDPAIRTERSLYSFCRQLNCADGLNPSSNLIDVKGWLYGTTLAGGAYNDGSVFAVKY